MPSHAVRAVILPALLLAGCSRAVVVFGGGGALVADPESVDFGVVFVGGSVERVVRLRNDGAVDRDLVLAPSASGAEVAVSPTALRLPAAGETEVRLTWSALAWGEQAGALTVAEAGGATLLDLPLHALVQVDADGDGWGSVATGGEDCDDTDAAVNPDAAEEWYDGVDQDCSGGSDDDQDGDGVVVDKDCDDTDPDAAIPGPEAWNGRDDDCDGQVDDLAIGEAARGVVRGSWEAPLLGLPWTLSVGRDLLGDGGVDLVVGSPEGPGGGAVWILPANDLVDRSLALADAAVARLDGEGSPPTGYLGPLQRDVGDDDAADLLVGAADLDGRAGGQVWLVPGGERLAGVDEVEERASAWFVGDSSQDTPWMGTAVDLDGDGVREAAVGAPYDQFYDGDDPPVEYTGNVSVFSSAHLRGEQALSDAEVQIHGSRPLAFLGTTLIATDLDADGYEDLIAGAPGDSAGAAFAGAVYWFAGDARLQFAERADDASRARFVGARANAGLGGLGLGRPGDNDGDGALDLALASPTEGVLALWLAAGTLEGVHNAVDGDRVWMVGEGGCGTGLVADSDLDGDAVDELLVGCPFEGSAERGTVRWIDGRTSADAADARAVLSGDHDRALLGEWLVGGFDADGDGRDDVLIGAPGDDGAGEGAGAVFLLTAPEASTH